MAWRAVYSALCFTTCGDPRDTPAIRSLADLSTGGADRQSKASWQSPLILGCREDCRTVLRGACLSGRGRISSQWRIPGYGSGKTCATGRVLTLASDAGRAPAPMTSIDADDGLGECGAAQRAP